MYDEPRMHAIKYACSHCQILLHYPGNVTIARQKKKHEHTITSMWYYIALHRKRQKQSKIQMLTLVLSNVFFFFIFRKLSCAKCVKCNPFGIEFWHHRNWLVPFVINLQFKFHWHHSRTLMRSNLLSLYVIYATKFKSK